MTETPVDAAGVHRDDAGRLTLRLSARYGHGVQSVWRALTDDAEMSTWTPWQVTIDPVAGGVVTVAFVGDDAVEGDVVDAERPRRLVLRIPAPSGGDDEMLRWELQPTDDGCAVVFDVTVDDAEHVTQTAAGYDISLQHLATLLAGEPVVRADSPAQDPRFDSLVQEYDDLLGSDIRELTQ